MDDGRIASEMSMDEIARRLEAIGSDLTSIKTDVSALKTDVSTLKTDMSAVKTDISGLKTAVAGLGADLGDVGAEMKSGFDSSKMRDEELRDLMKFGLEAREALRETVEARFDETGKKHDEQISLLKDVIRTVRR